MTRMESVSKRSARWNIRIGSRNFFEISENCAKLLRKARRRQNFFTIMAYSSKQPRKPKNSIGRKKFRRSSQTFFFFCSPLLFPCGRNFLELGSDYSTDRIGSTKMGCKNRKTKRNLYGHVWHMYV